MVFNTNKEKGNTATYKTVVETNIDEIFILTENFEMYIIPNCKIDNRSTLNICSKYYKYGVSL